MSGTDEICKYVLDPDDPETWGGEEGDECYVEEEVLNEDSMWTCPHDAEEGEDLCVFHLPVEEKDGGERPLMSFWIQLMRAFRIINPE